MGINLKGLAKKNKAKSENELHRRVLLNKTVHALVEMQLRGEVRKFAQVNKQGKTDWYWGLIEWFDEKGNYIPEFLKDDI